MARLIPDDFDLSAVEPSERRVLEALLESLGPGWLLLPQVPFVDRGQDGEADLVALNAEHGAVVFEVKGGTISVRDGAKPGSTLTLALPVAEKGRYQLKGVLTKARDYGIVSVALDDKEVLANFDGYNFPAVVLSDELDWGAHDLDAGEQVEQMPKMEGRQMIMIIGPAKKK